MLTITLGLPSSAKGTTVGLTGAFDDDMENDLTYLNGTGHISMNSTESEIFDWASTCKFMLADWVKKVELNISMYCFRMLDDRTMNFSGIDVSSCAM